MHTNMELVFNLWMYYDGASGFVYGVSGRAYRVRGTEQEKLALLNSLALTDYTSAKRYELPARFQAVLGDGTTLKSVTHLHVAQDPDARVFDNVLQNIASELPPLPRFSETGWHATPQKIPKEPLCVITVLYEDESGNTRPISSKEDLAWADTQEQIRGRTWLPAAD